MNDNLINKIRGILQLAENNSNPHEKELAFLKAQELASKYNVELASIELFKNSKVEPIVKGDSISLGNRRSVTDKFVSWILQNHFNVKVILFGNRAYGKNLYFVGSQSDIQIATYLHGYLNQTFMDLWHGYANRTNAPASARASFLFGCYQGLDEKLKQTKKNAENEQIKEIRLLQGDEAAEKTIQNLSVMVVSKKERLESEFNRMFPKVRKGTHAGIALRSSNAIESGRQAGKTISVRQGIGAGNKSLLTS